MEEHFQQQIDQALAAEKAYRKTASPAALEEVVSAWEALAQDPALGSAPDRVRLQVLNGLGRARVQRYWAHGELDDLSRALATWREALDLLPSGEPDRAGYLCNLGIAFGTRFDRIGDAEDLDRALRCFHEAVEVTPASSPDRALFLSNLGAAVRRRAVYGGDPQELSPAVATLRQAAEAATAGTPAWAAARHGLAEALLARYALTGVAGELEEAVQSAAEALKATAPEGPAALDRLGTLGSALGTRFARSGDLGDLEASVQVFERAFIRTPEPSPQRPGRASNLALGLRQVYERTGDPRHLDRAVEVLEGACRRIEPASPTAVYPRLNLAGALLRRQERSGDPADLAHAIDLFESVRAVARLRSPEHAMALGNLSTALAWRFDERGDSADLDSAIAHARQAVDATPAGPHRARHLGNLASALHRKLTLRDDPELAAECTAIHRQAVREGMDGAVEVSLLTARFWADQAFHREAWSEACEAYSHAYEALDHLLRVQPLRPARESWLREFQGLAGRAAFARSRVGDLDGAVAALEAGNGRLLAEAVESRRATLETLAVRAPALHHRYLEIAGRLAALEDALALAATSPEPRPTPSLGGLRRLRARLDEVIEEVRGIQGFAGFLTNPGLAEVQAILARSPAQPVVAVYLVSTLAGSVALVVTPETIREVRLEITLAELYQAVTSRPPASGPEGVRGGPTSAREAEPLLAAMPFLGERLMAPVASELRELVAARVILLPAGPLAALPLHAAPYQGASGTSCLLDEWEMAFAPNLRCMDAAQQEITRRTGPPRLVAVADPRPEAHPLLGAVPEVIWARRHFGEPLPPSFVGRQATREAVLEELSRGTHLHFACHGRFHRLDPLESGVELAGSDFLTLRDLLYGRARPASARLAVLSACESAVVEERSLPDEYLGLPAAFLQAGVPGVVGTLWQVPDLSTALLMGRFYQLLFGEPGPARPAAALREAQHWLRALSRERLRELLFSLRHEEEALSVLAAEILVALGEEPFPFANPRYWAAFVFVGT